MRGAKMRYEVITYNAVIGSHRWENAPDEFSYLRNVHRHVFKIRCKFHVTHSDRQIEINDMQDIIARYFSLHYPVDASGVFFGGRSCEDIARECIENFGCYECEVLEDGFGGACVRA